MSSDGTLLWALSEIRARTGVGVTPMLSELPDAIMGRIDRLEAGLHDIAACAMSGSFFEKLALEALGHASEDERLAAVAKRAPAGPAEAESALRVAIRDRKAALSRLLDALDSVLAGEALGVAVTAIDAARLRKARRAYTVAADAVDVALAPTPERPAP